VRLVKFEPEHLERFANYGGQEALVLALKGKERDLEMLSARGTAWSGFVDERIAGCGGLFPLNDYRATAWAVFARGRAGDFLAVDRAVRRGLRESAYKVIDAYVDPLSPRALRWIASLGFKLVNPYKPYIFPDGRGASEWARYADR
jgi:RimJ/RimL family protein N-acetyltransferase